MTFFLDFIIKIVTLSLPDEVIQAGVVEVRQFSFYSITPSLMAELPNAYSRLGFSSKEKYLLGQQGKI